MANDKRAVTIAYFVTHPGEYLDGITIQDLMDDTSISRGTAYSHINTLIAEGLVKPCGLDMRNPTRKAFYLDTKAYAEYSPTEDRILLPGATNNEAVIDALMSMDGKLDALMLLVVNLSKPTTTAKSGAAKSNKVVEPVPVNIPAYKQAIRDAFPDDSDEDITTRINTRANIKAWMESGNDVLDRPIAH